MNKKKLNGNGFMGGRQPVDSEYRPEIRLTKEQEKEMDNLLKFSRFKGSNRRSFMDTDTLHEIHCKVQEKYNLRRVYEAIAIIGTLCQLGGTSLGCEGTLVTQLEFNDVQHSDDIRRVEAKLKDVKEIFAQCGQKNKLRKYAKSMKNPILRIVKNYQIVGNLYQKVKDIHPELELSNELSYCLSDFRVDAEDIDPKAN